ncbi:MAG TPA: hypothetical protein VEG33_11015 [Streptosporangiaceae bacterium]|nr:hypothetical protein [Streptosporangiaceae bacterium]
MTGIPGSPPDLRTPPPGCPFHPRCGFATDVCRTEMPAAFRPLSPGGGRSAACWLHDGAHEVPAELATPEPGSGPGAGPGPGGTRPTPAPLLGSVQPAGATTLPDPAAVPPEGGASLPDAASTTTATGPMP